MAVHKIETRTQIIEDGPLYIQRLVFSNTTASAKIYGWFIIDCQKYKKLKFKLTLINATMSDGYYIKLQSVATGTDTTVYTFTKTQDVKEIDLDPSWTSTTDPLNKYCYLILYGVTSAAYGKVCLDNLEMTPR